MSSGSFPHASQRRHIDSNCALALSSVAAWPSVRMSGDLPKMRCSDQNQRCGPARRAARGCAPNVPPAAVDGKVRAVLIDRRSGGIVSGMS